MDTFVESSEYLHFRPITAGIDCHLPLDSPLTHSLFSSGPLLYSAIHSTSPRFFRSIHPLYISCSKKDWATSRATSYSPHVPTCTHPHTQSHLAEAKAACRKPPLVSCIQLDMTSSSYTFTVWLTSAWHNLISGLTPLLSREQGILTKRRLPSTWRSHTESNT